MPLNNTNNAFSGIRKSFENEDQKVSYRRSVFINVPSSLTVKIFKFFAYKMINLDLK